MRFRLSCHISQIKSNKKVNVMQKEIWKDISGYEGYYQVSSLGRVKSLDRCIKHWRGGSSIRSGRLLKQTDDGKGYWRVNLSKNGGKTHKVHQLVAIAFLGHKPNGMTFVVNHVDLNKKNNKLSNLEIVTARENANHKHIKSSSKYTGVGWNKNSKKWEAQILICRKKRHLGFFNNEKDAHNAYKSELSKID